MSLFRVCRDCGCTDLNACITDDATGLYACWWVETDLCSFCAFGHKPTSIGHTPPRPIETLHIGGLL